jgi:hypothetical protein
MEEAHQVASRAEDQTFLSGMAQESQAAAAATAHQAAAATAHQAAVHQAVAQGGSQEQ